MTDRFTGQAIGTIEDAEEDAVEGNGDEADGNISEEDLMVHHGDGPGCPIADTGFGDIDSSFSMDGHRERFHCLGLA